MNRVRAAGLAAMVLGSIALAGGGIVDDVRAASATRNFTLADREIQSYRSSAGVTEDLLEALSWLARATLDDKQYDRADAYATETRQLSLDLLKRQGLIDELDLMHLNGEGHYYERKLGRDHIHMACLRCGKITEFVSKTFESLKKELNRDCRFHIVVARLEVGGYCSDCRR